MSNGSITDEQAHEWLQEVVDHGWISLHYDSPALGSTDKSEIAGGGYQRFKMIWTQPNNRAIWSQVDARFVGLTQNKLVYFGIWNRKGSGTVADPARLMFYGELPKPVVVLNGKGYILHQHMIVVSFG